MNGAIPLGIQSGDAVEFRKAANGRNCYAEVMAARFSDPGQAYHGLAIRTASGGRWTGAVRLVEEHLEDPLKWRKPARVFVNSMSDLFHESLRDEVRDQVFAVMALTPHHTFQVLTKRPSEMLRYLGQRPGTRQAIAEATLRPGAPLVPVSMALATLTLPFPNVWLGVSVENQAAADERIPLLLQTPAAVRFLSVEPMLGPVDLRRWLNQHEPYLRVQQIGLGLATDEADARLAAGLHRSSDVGWVICGAESGPGARPMDLDWVRSLRDQCAATAVPFFFKQQLDAHGHKLSTPELDGVRHVAFPVPR